MSQAQGIACGINSLINDIFTYRPTSGGREDCVAMIGINEENYELGNKISSSSESGSFVEEVNNRSNLEAISF